MAFRWALVGCGEIANERVLPAIVEHRGSELIAVADAAAERAGDAAERFGAPAAFDTLAELLQQVDVDAVYVATPPRWHCELTVQAAEAGRHVLCEKPMAPTVAECRRMIDAAREAKVSLAVSYYRRWYPAAAEIKRLIDAGAIGRPVRARILTGWPSDPDPAEPGYWRVQAGGGPLMDTACHRIDLMCYWLGEPRRVTAATSTLARDWEAPDTETVLCEMACGCHLTVQTQWSMPLSFDEIEIHGTKGSITASPFDGEHLVLRDAAGEDRVDLGPRAANVHLPLIASFAERAGTGRPPRFDAANSLQTTRIIDAAHRSARSGRRGSC